MATITEPTKIKLEFKEAVYMYGGDYNQGYNDGKDDGFEEGKQVGYDEGVEVGKANAPREERSVTYNANGTYQVLPSSSELLMDKVNVVVNIPDDGSYSDGYNDGKNAGFAEGEAYGKQNAPTEDLSVTLTSNGTYSYKKPQDKYYADVAINVNVPSEKTPTQEKSVTITKNGTEVVVPDTGFALEKVTVTTQIDTRLPEQTKEVTITENGTTDVLPDSGYTLAGVSVTTQIDTRLPEQEKSLEVTENKVYEVTPDSGYALKKVTVTGNVASSGGSGDDELVKIKCASDGITTALSGDYCRVTNFMEEFDFAKFSELKPTSCERLFFRYNGKKLVIKNLDTSEVTTMEMMFAGCENIQSFDLSSFDTSKVTNMYQMFSSCTSLKVVDFSGINTSKVTNMYGLFQSCMNLETLDLSSFDTSEVTDMGNLVYSCQKLTTLNLSSFDTSKATGMSMFQSTYALKNVTFGNNWASNPEVTSLTFNSTPLSRDSLLDLANKISDKSDTSIYTEVYTVRVRSALKRDFTEDELTALANQFTSKNWTLTWG